ncbi:uncharacterized protein DS421_15g502070 [Arachis hypogaea]|nr:uncharacterized protein DS421_15g502070 [Arachis hypogaea]
MLKALDPFYYPCLLVLRAIGFLLLPFGLKSSWLFLLAFSFSFFFFCHFSFLFFSQTFVFTAFSCFKNQFYDFSDYQ